MSFAEAEAVLQQSARTLAPVNPGARREEGADGSGIERAFRQVEARYRGTAGVQAARGHFSVARETQTISLSLRAYTDLLANAGCDQRTRRPGGGAMPLVGSRRCARLISS
jgi:hypothetical protein